MNPYPTPQSLELRKIAREFAESEILPVLDSARDIRYFIAVSGSVGYGFADRFSDIELEIYVRAGRQGSGKDRDHGMAGLVKRLAEAVNVWEGREFGGVTVSPGITSWPVDDILSGNFRPVAEGNVVRYYEMKNSFPLIDPWHIYMEMRRHVGFFGHEDILRIVRGLYLQMAELGLHIAEKSARRGLMIPAAISFHAALEAMLRLAHILNGEFFPHTKWLAASFKRLERKFGIDGFLERIDISDIPASIREFQAFARDFAKTELVGKWISQKEYEHPWQWIRRPDSYVFYPTLFKY